MSEIHDISGERKSIRVHSPPGGQSVGVFPSESPSQRARHVSNTRPERIVATPPYKNPLSDPIKPAGIISTSPSRHPTIKVMNEAPAGKQSLNLFGKRIILQLMIGGWKAEDDNKTSVKVRAPPGGSTSYHIFGVGAPEREEKPSIKVREPPGGKTAEHVFGIGAVEVRPKRVSREISISNTTGAHVFGIGLDKDARPSRKERVPPGGNTEDHIFGSAPKDQAKSKTREPPGGKTSLHLFGVDTAVDPSHIPQRTAHENTYKNIFPDAHDHHTSYQKNISPQHFRGTPRPHFEAPKDHASFLKNDYSADDLNNPNKRTVQPVHPHFQSHFEYADDGGKDGIEVRKHFKRLLNEVGGGQDHIQKEHYLTDKLG